MADNDFTLTGTAEIGRSRSEFGPEKRWSCTRGHVWYSRRKLIGVMIQPPPEIGGEPGEYCWKCLADLLREHIGRVREG